MAGKHLPLRDHLRATEASDGTVAMTFDAVARLVGGLPPSASRYREWWGNNSHAHALAWSDAGYRVDVLDLRGQRVVFARDATARPGPLPAAPTARIGSRAARPQ